MRILNGADRKFLRGLGQKLEPSVMVGKNGVTATVMDSTDKALTAHELVKVRFVERKDEKRSLIDGLALGTRSEVVGMIGHTALLYR
ncbi:MAG TPA: YhbY family RNA-binding protein, partial [Candidatus Hydrogenedentes bacterium]|nr:YhbY family RNA-binding protein [Candidatus Hydrogenedentota bacterium]